MEPAELKDVIEFPPFIFSPVYIRIIESVLAERRIRQIAQELGITEQNTNYYIKRLVSAQILEKGIKTSYREIKVREAVREQLKQKINEFKEAKKTILVQVVVHHIFVVWPIIKDSEMEFGKQRQRWKTKLEEKSIMQDSLPFIVEKTKKNLIIRFPRGTGVRFVGMRADPSIKTMNYYCLQKAEPIKNKIKGALELGVPHIKAHYSIQDNVAKKLTALGITMMIKEGKKWIAIDKSPHFWPRGEVETNDAEIAQSHLDLTLWWHASGNIIKNLQCGSVYNLPAGSAYPSGSTYNSGTNLRL